MPMQDPPPRATSRAPSRLPSRPGARPDHDVASRSARPQHSRLEARLATRLRQHARQAGTRPTGRPARLVPAGVDIAYPDLDHIHLPHPGLVPDAPTQPVPTPPDRQRADSTDEPILAPPDLGPADSTDEPAPAPPSSPSLAAGSGLPRAVDVLFPTTPREPWPPSQPASTEPGTLAADADHALREIEWIEHHKAKLEARLIDAYQGLHQIITRQHAAAPLANPTPATPESPARPPVVPVTAEQLTVKEIATATGVGVTEVRVRVTLAITPERHHILRERMHQGRLSLFRALKIVTAGQHLPDHVLPDLHASVLAPGRDGTTRSHPAFTDRLHRHVVGADPHEQPQRRAAAHAARAAHARTSPDGMARMSVTSTTERIIAILERADAMARLAKLT